MARSDRVTVGTTATLLATGVSQTGAGESDVLVTVPSGGVQVHVGGSDVLTTDNDTPVAAGERLAVTLESGETLYGIVAAGTQMVHVLFAKES